MVHPSILTTIGDVLRKIAFLHLNDVTPDAVVEVLHKKPNGMVVILPSAIRDVAAWKDLQHFFCIFPHSHPGSRRRVLPHPHLLRLRD